MTSGCNEQSKVPPKDLSLNECQAVTAPENSVRVPIDMGESIIAWRGTKLGGIRGHEGTLEFGQSDLFLKDNSIVGGYFIVNMKSLEVTDIPDEQATAKNNLKNHLKSELKTTEYPWSTFEITRITYTGLENLLASGNLTIRGITKTWQNIRFTQTEAVIEVGAKWLKILSYSHFYWWMVDGGWWPHVRP